MCCTRQIHQRKQTAFYKSYYQPMLMRWEYSRALQLYTLLHALEQMYSNQHWVKSWSSVQHLQSLRSNRPTIPQSYPTTGISDRRTISPATITFRESCTCLSSSKQYTCESPRDTRDHNFEKQRQNHTPTFPLIPQSKPQQPSNHHLNHLPSTIPLTNPTFLLSSLMHRLRHVESKTEKRRCKT